MLIHMSRSHKRNTDWHASFANKTGKVNDRSVERLTGCNQFTITRNIQRRRKGLHVPSRRY
jgi:hypothetical protein